MTKGSISRRYAKALFALALDKERIEEYGRELEEFARSVLKNQRCFRALADPLLPKDERMSGLAEIVRRSGVTPMVKNFILLLLEKGRLEYLPGIVREYGSMRDEALKILRVEVRTPKEPTGPFLKEVADFLKEKTQKEVAVSGTADPEILGGVILKIGHFLYDGSVRRELHRIQERMMGEEDGYSSG